MQMTLDALPVGASAVVTALRSTGAQRRRMLDLGFVPGSCVRALHVSPWSDPVAYGVRGARTRAACRSKCFDFSGGIAL